VHELRLDHVQDPLVVGDDENAHAGRLGDGVDPVGHRVEGVDVEPRVGLVEHREPRLQQRHLEDLHALLLAAGESLVEVARGEVARHVGQLHRRLRLLAEVLERDGLLATALAVGVDDRAQVLGDRHAGNGDRVLEGHEQAHAGALVGVGLRDVLAVEDDLPLGHLEVRVAHDGVGQGRLARAVGAHQGVELARADVQVHALEDLLLPGRDVQVLDLEVGHGLQLVRGSQ
jgi:hypothetical protein